eukprot:4465183-Pyramimonas_sp.AAC.1
MLSGPRSPNPRETFGVRQVSACARDGARASILSHMLHGARGDGRCAIEEGARATLFDKDDGGLERGTLGRHGFKFETNDGE